MRGELPSSNSLLPKTYDLLFETQGLFETHGLFETQRHRDTEGLNR
jgi:hypothetical protein